MTEPNRNELLERCDVRADRAGMVAVTPAGHRVTYWLHHSNARTLSAQLGVEAAAARAREHEAGAEPAERDTEHAAELELEL